MASTSIPLEKERSIEVMPRSCSASSELTYALFEERTRSSSRITAEGYISSLSKATRPPTPLLKTPPVSFVSKSRLVEDDKSPETESLPPENAAPKQTPVKAPETTATKNVSSDNEEKEETSSASSEKENEVAPKKDKKMKKKGLMRFLRSKPTQGKPPKNPMLKRSVKKSAPEKKIIPENPAKKIIPEILAKKTIPQKKVVEPWHTQQTLDKIVAAPHYVSPVETTSDSDKAALEKAKQYTLMSTALLDSLKNDNGTEDVRESIQQAKLAYEYAMKARHLYNSVRSRKGSSRSLCDDSVNSTSVASSHITEKAGNITGQGSKSIISDLSSISKKEQEAVQDFSVETPLSSSLGGNEAPEDFNAIASSSYIEIDNDGKIRFEAPITSTSSTKEEEEHAESGIQDMLQIASSFRTNQTQETESELETAIEVSPDRTVSPLSSILGVVKKNVQQQSSALEKPVIAGDDSVEAVIADAVITTESSPEEIKEPETNPLEEDASPTHDTHVASELCPEQIKAAESASLDGITSPADDTQEVKRVQSIIYYPPALEPSRSSVTHSGNTHHKMESPLRELSIRSLLSQDTESLFSEHTTPSQKLLIRHMENRRNKLMIAFPVIKCGSGLECVAPDQDHSTPQEPKKRGNIRITVVDEKDEYEKGVAARRGYKQKAQPVADDKKRQTVWQRASEGMVKVRSSSQAAKEWTREELKEARSLAEEILNGQVNVIEEVNPFVCSSGAVHVKHTFDDDTYATYSEASSSSTEGHVFTDDEEQTYETLSDGSIVDTTGTRSNSLEIPHEGFEVFEKSDEWEEPFEGDWKATFDEDWKAIVDGREWKASFDKADDSTSGSDSSYSLPRQEMIVLGTVSSESESCSDESSETYESDSDSSFSSISNGSRSE